MTLAKVAQIAVSINQVVQSLGDYLDPLLIELESAVDAPPTKTEEEGVSLPASFYMLPSVLMMALFFLAQGLSEDYWTEREAGTLRRGACTPRRMSSLLAGKLLAVSCVFAAIGVLLFAAGYLDEWSTRLTLKIWPAKLPDVVRPRAVVSVSSTSGSRESA